jgi:peptidoglycan/xylan/chitin deacetylase (PgdA/CDA1 family)
MYLNKIPRFLQDLFPEALWHVATTAKKLYLTFDDGPTPEVTDWVLNILQRYEARATFFVLGKNVALHREIFLNIIASGHAIGNHSYNHLSGWKSEDEIYYHDIEMCSDIIRTIQSTLPCKMAENKTKKLLFRPPYGRLTLSQYASLSRQYEIVMWDILSGDFDARISSRQCFENCRKYARPGSVIVFHDTHRAFEKLKTCLPETLEYFGSSGYSFARLDEAVDYPNTTL